MTIDGANKKKSILYRCPAAIVFSLEVHSAQGLDRLEVARSGSFKDIDFLGHDGDGGGGYGGGKCRVSIMRRTGQVTS